MDFLIKFDVIQLIYYLKYQFFSISNLKNLIITLIIINHYYLDFLNKKIIKIINLISKIN